MPGRSEHRHWDTGRRQPVRVRTGMSEAVASLQSGDRVRGLADPSSNVPAGAVCGCPSARWRGPMRLQGRVGSVGDAVTGDALNQGRAPIHPTPPHDRWAQRFDRNRPTGPLSTPMAALRRPSDGRRHVDRITSVRRRNTGGRCPDPLSANRDRPRPVPIRPETVPCAPISPCHAVIARQRRSPAWRRQAPGRTGRQQTAGSRHSGPAPGYHPSAAAPPSVAGGAKRINSTRSVPST